MTARASRLAREVADKWLPGADDPLRQRDPSAALAALIDAHPLMAQVREALEALIERCDYSHLRAQGDAALAAITPEEKP